MSDILFANRSGRGKLRVADEERLWFLDQILTQSFQGMQPGEARDTALITVHGRMQAYMETVATDDAVLLHYELELRDVVPETLSKYVFATRVTLDDVTDEMGLVLVVGDEWRQVAADVAPGGVLHETKSLGPQAGYVWVPAGRVDEVIAALQRAGIRAASEEELEAIRIAHGVARWGRDMDTKTFPQEAGIDGRAVHYEKGCYLGQEAMAKIHFRGKVNRRLVRLKGEGRLAPGEELTAGDEKVGRVTSASNGSGLALVKHTTEAGTEVVAGSTRAQVLS
ncbi:MAG: hypothetical protein M3174_04965 [Actinomycetota bacterium]|nr:hypothetical protein [Actinomycetota bacterium]